MTSTSNSLPNLRADQPLAIQRLVFIFTIGALLVVASVISSTAFGWEGIWPQVFLATGTTTALGSALFWLQRSFFVRTVSEVQQIEQRVDERVEQVEGEIRDLAAAVAAETSDRHTRQDEAARRPTDDFTWEAVREAIAQANSDHLTREDRFRVRASIDPRGLRIRFQLIWRAGRGVADEPLINLTPWTFDVAVTGMRPIAWSPYESASVALDHVVTQLEEAGAHALRESFDPNLLPTNLLKSLELALSNRRGELDPPLKGALIEQFDDDVVFTDAGVVESLSRGMLAGVEAFPETLERFRAPGTSEYIRPDPPRDIPADQWALLMECAETTYIGWSAWTVQRRGMVRRMAPYGLLGGTRRKPQ